MRTGGAALADRQRERNSGIELLKLFAILLIISSHVFQTVTDFEAAAPAAAVPLYRATCDPQRFFAALFGYHGALGNHIFFLCSAWFFLDGKIPSSRKLFQMFLTIWTVSVLILVCVLALRGGALPPKTILHQLFPTTFANNWYLTCYLLFGLLCPLLNRLLVALDQRRLLLAFAALVLLRLGCAVFPEAWGFLVCNLVTWVAVYFALAYARRYLRKTIDDPRRMAILLAGSLAVHIASVGLLDLLGLRFSAFSNRLLLFSSLLNPALILIAFSLLMLARRATFRSKTINALAGLSMLLYIIHENALLRQYYRPPFVAFFLERFGDFLPLLWLPVLTLLVALFALVSSTLYALLLKKPVNRFAGWLYDRLSALMRRAADRLARLQ